MRPCCIISKHQALIWMCFAMTSYPHLHKGLQFPTHHRLYCSRSSGSATQCGVGITPTFMQHSALPTVVGENSVAECDDIDSSDVSNEALTFRRRWMFRLWISGLWHCVNFLADTDVSKEHAASIFRAKIEEACFSEVSVSAYKSTETRWLRFQIWEQS
jgi:hypothetical protein